MISVIIPALNEAKDLPGTLRSLLEQCGEFEAIVVDGGSFDCTREIVRGFAGVRLLRSQPGRGLQMNCGAEAACGELLLFLHADSVLTKGCGSLAAAFLMDPVNEDRAAWFQLSFDDQGAGPNRVAKWANWRSKTLGLPYGDQGLLISKSLYNLTGGYSDLPLMEDVDLVRRLGRTRLVGLQGQVETSAERYQRGGYWWRPARNLFCLFLFYCRAPIGLIDRIYRG